jgi:hypothetical protein
MTLNCQKNVSFAAAAVVVVVHSNNGGHRMLVADGGGYMEGCEESRKEGTQEAGSIGGWWAHE